MSVYSVDKLITEARRLAKEYRAATGKTLPISGEIAINDAIRLLNMTPVTDLNSGYDATLERGNEKLRVQVKGRAIVNARRSGHRLGQLKLEQDWDAIALVIMDENYEPMEIYLAEREVVMETLRESKSKRGSISLARCKIIGELLWTAENGKENGGYWSNTD